MKSSLFVCLTSSAILTHPAAARPPETLDEARRCILFVSMERDDGAKAAGSAFVVEEDGRQWIYTNAHNVAGADRIAFHDQEGRLVTGFGKFECYATGCGEVETQASGSRGATVTRYGGDGVRLQLGKPRELALRIHRNPGQLREGMEVVTLGDNDGDKELDTLEGEVLSSNGKVVTTTCATRPGSSGGALLDAESLAAIGLNTWGIPSQLKTLDLLWSKDPEAPQDMLAGASILHAAEWAEVSAADFAKGSRYVDEYIETLKVLLLIYHTTPTEAGFSINLGAPFAASLTHGEAFEQMKANQVLGPVAELNRKLGRAAESNLRVNNMEIVKTYAKAIKSIRQIYADQSERILKQTPPFYRIELENIGAIQLGSFCHTNLENAETWFTRKASVGGKMPLGRWVHLPPLSEF